MLTDASADVSRLELPLPFGLGSVNAWLIDDDPLTLVDAGPATPEAREALARGLRASGHELTEVGLVVVSHDHWDHAGGVAHVVRVSGARVAAAGELCAAFARLPEQVAADGRYAAAMMLRHGYDEDQAAVSLVAGHVAGSFCEPFDVTLALETGSRIALRDRSLAVLSRPGHSLADIALWDERHEVLLTGDHLLGDGPSIPLLGLPFGAALRDAAAAAHGPRTPQLPAAEVSLRATAATPCAVVAPGHGPAFNEHTALVERHLAASARRRQAVAGALGVGSMTGRELSEVLWGDTSHTPHRTYLRLCWTLGHLDALVASGVVAEDSDRETPRFGLVRAAVPAA